MQEVIKLRGVICCTVGRGVVGLHRLRLHRGGGHVGCLRRLLDGRGFRLRGLLDRRGHRLGRGCAHARRLRSRLRSRGFRPGELIQVLELIHAQITHIFQKFCAGRFGVEEFGFLVGGFVLEAAKYSVGRVLGLAEYLVGAGLGIVLYLLADLLGRQAVERRLLSICL